MDKLLRVGLVRFKVTQIEIKKSEEEDRLDIEVPGTTLRLVGDSE